METSQVEEAADQTEIDELREALRRLNEFLDETEPNVGAVLASKEGNAVEDDPADFYNTRELNLQAQLSDDLRAITKSVAESALEKELIPHELGHSPQDHELSYLRLPEHPDVEAAIEFLTRVEAAQTFYEDEAFAETIDFYTLVPTYRGTNAAFFRKPATKRDLAVDSTRRTGYRAVLGEANRYEEFDRKVFRFDGKIDFFVWEEVVFISSNHKLRQILGRFEAVRQQVDSHSQDLSRQLPEGIQIGNMEDFRDACKRDGRLASKLARVSQREYWSEVTRDDLENAIREYRLDERGKIEYSDGTLKYSSSPQQRYTLLKLLDDDYLGSVMTGEKYAAGNKRRLPGT